MSADTELALLQGKIDAEPVAVKTEQQLRQEKEAAIQAAFAGMPPAKTAEELEAQTKARLADQRQAQLNSMVMSTGRWEVRG